MIQTQPIKHSKLLLSVGLLNLASFLFLFLGILAPLIFFLFSDNQFLVNELKRMPWMIFIFVTGTPFLLYGIIANIEYLFKGKYFKHLMISSVIIIVYVWFLIIYSLFTFKMPDVLSVNFYFLPLYAELIIIKFQQPDLKENKATMNPSVI